MLYTTEAPAEEVWVRTGSLALPVTHVNPAPLQADEYGHVWLFDGGASDIEAPYTCGLCGRPQWKTYNKPCEDSERLAEANAERDRWIDEHRVQNAGLIAMYKEAAA